MSAYHLKMLGHLPDWVPSGHKPPQDVKEHCSVCGTTRGFMPGWSMHPDWNKR